MEHTNETRAAHAQAAINAFSELAYHCDDAENLATKLGDCIADLFHLAHQNGIDIDQLISTARGHFKAELEEESEARDA